MAYNLLKAVNILASQSMAASFSSSAQEIQQQDNIGVQLNFTGVPVGTFQIQVSADHKQDAEGNIQVAGNWTTLPLASVPTAAGAPGVFYIELNQLSAPYIRIGYTRTSGTGTLNAFIVGKGV